MLRALVTGATGFIGSNLARELVKRDYEVTCLARRTSSLKWLQDLDVSVVYGDCTDKDSLKQLPSNFHYVFHLAGLTKAKKEEDFLVTNVNGTENLLRFLSDNAHEVKRFIYMSSLAAAGPSWDGIPLDEAATPRPVSAYGKSKLEGERVASGYKDKLPVSVIRPPAVYGPRDRDFFLFYRMIKRGFYPYWGKCYYSLLYVDDLVRGMIAAAEAREAAGKTYFLTDSRIYSNDEIVFEIMEAMGTRALRIGIPAPAMKLLAKISGKLASGASIINLDKLREIKHNHWTCNAKKAELEFGFIPRVTIKEGIKWTADWYKIHKWL
ncbi:MAG: NAD-dependent epimerase/dehydratase family protein [Nitrospiraceae bacterium]|nr:MAG: NAD-dependent epimerase/dehydratase family protein [Nitrospiraceae bacterium]